jgi:hypothetical protein
MGIGHQRLRGGALDAGQRYVESDLRRRPKPAMCLNLAAWYE